MDQVDLFLLCYHTGLVHLLGRFCPSQSDQLDEHRRSFIQLLEGQRSHIHPFLLLILVNPEYPEWKPSIFDPYIIEDLLDNRFDLDPLCIHDHHRSRGHQALLAHW